MPTLSEHSNGHVDPEHETPVDRREYPAENEADELT
ncbi:MAG: hypothetical protein JWO57_4076 [Pseudonocardiales bacterium]|nr:hypothetical protein [Pseudonocardiales bacterium]